MWGESNTRYFIDWADACQSESIRKRSINSTGGYNYKENLSSDVSRKAMVDILSLIKNNRTLSVQHFFNIAPPTYVSNPTTKYLLLQLYFEDCIKLKGEVDNSTYKEKNYTMLFSKELSSKQPQTNINNSVKRGHSNIESMIDNNWAATGRKLDFEKKQKESKREFNINLKNPNTVTTNKPAVKPIIQTQKEKQPEEVKPIIPTNIFEKPNIKVEETVKSIKYINIPKPEVKEEVKLNNVTLNLTERPKQIEPEIIIDNKKFAGLNSYELYFIYNFLKDTINRNIEATSSIKNFSKIVLTRADMEFLKEGNGVSLVIKILVVISSLLLIGLFFLGIVFKNKQKSKARKDYLKQIKESSYKRINEDLNYKYPNIITKLY
ncbi:hypothetical protein SCORR_v1c09560 [Spiroplasma corruscae]|uniref:Uncharacterized protein n=1 Tax=Spiroplasma corruscae TaxID=216934 RepID=A0A222EQD2_9MOLU|nr:hypothetical protein [Spiroplasma corruscae]ASP28728.1 hypothetical protein SCORR_v1c09560 [Spiroplasma corruscae]